MERRKKRLLLGGLTVILVGAGLLSYVLRGVAPWMPTGTLVIMVREAPTLDESDTAFGIGIDDVRIQPDEGDAKRVSVLTRRVALRKGDAGLTRLIETPAAEGQYAGIAFRLTSPELRNDTAGDTPPEQVRLAYEQVSIPASYTITRNSTTVIIVGFETHQAIRNNKGEDVYLPVFQVETRTNATVGDDENGIPYVSGGTIVSSATYGMDWNGAIRQNMRATDQVSDEPTTRPPEPIDIPLTETLPAEEDARKASSTTATSSEEGAPKEQLGETTETEEFEDEEV